MSLAQQQRHGQASQSSVLCRAGDVVRGCDGRVWCAGAVGGCDGRVWCAGVVRGCDAGV